MIVSNDHVCESDMADHCVGVKATRGRVTRWHQAIFLLSPTMLCDLGLQRTE